MAHTLPCIYPGIAPEITLRSTNDVVERCAQFIDREYGAWPVLRLTKGQMARLWCLDRAVCDAAVDRLTERRRLRRAANGTYVRQNG